MNLWTASSSYFCNVFLCIFSGGLSNILYYIALPSPAGHAHGRKETHHPKNVLIRVYGPTHGDRGIEHMITESVIFTLLSERSLGPKLYGLFPGGRIEQYINARPLQTKELADEKLTNLIAKKMAAIHSMEVCSVLFYSAAVTEISDSIVFVFVSD